MLDPDYEPALGEPALLAAHGDPVLRGQAVQRRERRDVVGLGMQPADRIRPHHVVEEQASLLAPEAQRSSQLRVIGRAAGVDEPAHKCWNIRSMRSASAIAARHRRAMVSRSPRPAGRCRLTTPMDSGRIAARWQGRYPRCAKRVDAGSA